jgi:glutamate synthase (ferredoxin)
MAKLGVRTVDELIGRTDLLCIKDEPEHSRAHLMDLTALMHKKENSHFKPEDAYDFHLENTLDEKVLLKKIPLNGHKKQLTVHVTNTDRTFGTMFGSAITRKFGTSLEEDTYRIKCIGSGGQSFGAFIPKGLTLELCGDSNDYFGKGLSGGQLIVYPPENAAFKAEENIIIGNVALYGATSGKVFINGIAGERFAVRNSGAFAVVEGVGDHGCEYMTGGRVVVLGRTGKNFAAGMSGGIAYVLDEDRDLYLRLNKELVSLEEVTEKYDVLELKTLIEEHAQATGSEKAKRIAADFKGYLPKFKKIIPRDYKKIMEEIAVFEGKGLNEEESRIEAFYSVISSH